MKVVALATLDLCEKQKLKKVPEMKKQVALIVLHPH